MRNERVSKLYDLLIKGGTIVDPAERLHAQSDLAISRGKIMQVSPGLSEARSIINAQDCIVTPGLIDLHVHVFPGVSHFGINADLHCLARGATTVVDAGSSGADTFDGFRRYVIDVSSTSILAFLNISSMGMISPQVGELEDIRFANVEAAIEACERNRDVIQGVKVRLSKNVVGKNGLQPLMLAKRVSDAVKMPLMVHVGDTPNPLGEILTSLKKRDIMTHCFHGKKNGIFEGARLLPEAQEAIRRGVVFDVGHGAGSFSFDVAEKALAQGITPDTISSDLHNYNVHGPVFDLATTMSKFLHLGLSLDTVLAKTTSTPANLLGLGDKIGTLKQGASADVAIFKLEEGRYKFEDSMGKNRFGKNTLTPLCVVKGGKQIMNHLPKWSK